MSLNIVSSINPEKFEKTSHNTQSKPVINNQPVKQPEVKTTDNVKVDNSVLGKIKHKIQPVVNFVTDVENSAIKQGNNLKNEIKHVAGKVSDQIGDAVHPLRVWKNDNLPIPPDKGGLKLTSYNIYLGGKRINQVEQYLKKENPDVICLQEASAESAQRLGKKLGMHVAYYQMERGYDRNMGKAILSKYPINDVKNVDYENSAKDKLTSFTKGLKEHHPSGEVLESRSMLTVNLQIGKKNIEIVDTHLSLGDPVANTKQINQLADYINQQKAKGKIVIAAGDFNTNMALAGNGKADAPGKLNTPTDTIPEFNERYKRGAGNIENPKVKTAADKLANSTNVGWEKAEKRTVILDGKTITPEQAKKELDSGKVAKDSPRYQSLMQVIDGITHIGARKRFDNIFTTKDVKIKDIEIDQTTKGSDHQPVSVDVSWK